MSDPRKLGEGVLKALELDVAFQKPVDSPSPSLRSLHSRADRQAEIFEKQADLGGFTIPPGRAMQLGEVWIGPLAGGIDLSKALIDFVWGADFKEMVMYLDDIRIYHQNKDIYEKIRSLYHLGLSVNLIMRPKLNHNPTYQIPAKITHVSSSTGPMGPEHSLKLIRTGPVTLIGAKYGS